MILYRHLQTAFVSKLTHPRVSEPLTMVREPVEIYNNWRLNLSLKNKTPDEVHRAF